MDDILKNKNRFFAALKEYKESYGHGVQNYLAVSSEISKGYISQLFQIFKGKSIEDVTVSFELQVKIANACGYDYLEFLQRGKEILEGTKGKPSGQSRMKSHTPIPIDPSVQILQEALEETGVKINNKQKEAVIKILREELKESEIKSKEGIKKYLEAFGK